MTQSHPFLDPPSNGKCLGSKEAADEGLCQREACLGWGCTRFKEPRTFKLVADTTPLVATKTALLSKQQFVSCGDGLLCNAMAARAEHRLLSVRPATRILPRMHGAMAKAAAMMRAAQQEPCVSSSPQPAYRQQHRS